jgi:large subunit ribosomal protein L22
VTGPKLNEASFVAGERTGTKATAKYVRSSASKARVVLDLIRGLPVRRADEVLQFTDRSVSVNIRKVLASAVANAQHNDELDPETLFVKACFADEGPTLKRFTPRARGRAGRIRKRTTHLTIVLGVLDDDRLEIVQAREARRTAAGRRRRTAATAPAASRRARVERSRQRAAQLRDGEQPTESTEADQQLAHGAAAPNEDGSAPEGFEIKGNADSMLYHVPGSRFYEQTQAEVYFATEEDAEAAGYELPPSQREDESAIADAAEPKTDADGGDAMSGASGEGSASDEPHAARGESEADAEPAAGTADEEDQQ